MPKIWQFTEEDDGTISGIKRSYNAEIESPITKRKLVEKVEESLSSSDLHKALNLNGNAAKIAKLEEKLADLQSKLDQKNERIEKLVGKLDKRKADRQKRLAELKA